VFEFIVVTCSPLLTFHWVQAILESVNLFNGGDLLHDFCQLSKQFNARNNWSVWFVSR